MLDFQEVARVNVEENRPMPYGSRLWKNHQGSISIGGFNNQDITVISVYISPYIHAIDELDHCLRNSKGKILIARDFNVNFNENSSERNSINQLLEKYSLSSTLPESFSTTNNGTHIDNIFTNFRVEESGRYIPHTSYHDPLYAKF
ncbi:hypothetical protein INT47_009172 [Mucor saturninus]|uniref:Endonuclease/exonuclease/phosphatase domain-containing protein n=1 Tax=Mucor saturninus TaxID=64648 RepID=A0A8H7RMZ8_9FUNG|nr:hypothetical protein INT47_009172 [Mucor saturninus]